MNGGRNLRARQQAGAQQYGFVAEGLLKLALVAAALAALTHAAAALNGAF